MNRPEKREMGDDQGDGRCDVSVMVKEQRWVSDEALAGSPQHDGDSESELLKEGARTSLPTPTLRSGGSKINIIAEFNTAHYLYSVACFLFNPSLARRIFLEYAAEIMSTQAAAPNAGNAAFKV